VKLIIHLHLAHSLRRGRAVGTSPHNTAWRVEGWC